MYERSGIERLLPVLGLSADALQSSGHDEAIAIRYGDGFVCVLAPSSGSNLLGSTPIAFVPEEARSALFETALLLNRSAGTVRGGVIGYDAVLSQLEYSTHIPTEGLSSAELAAQLAGFLHKAIELRAVLFDVVHARCA